MSEKKTVEEKSARLSKSQTSWVEPMKEWLKQAQTVDKIAQDDSLTEKKAVAKKIFGSNLLLSKKIVVWGEEKNLGAVEKNLDIAKEKNPEPLHKTQWTAVWAARTNEKKISLSCVLAPCFTSSTNLRDQYTKSNS